MTTIGTLLTDGNCYRGFLNTRTLDEAVTLAPPKDHMPGAPAYEVRTATGRVVGAAWRATDRDGVTVLRLLLTGAGGTEPVQARLVARHGVLALEAC